MLLIRILIFLGLAIGLGLCNAQTRSLTTQTATTNSAQSEAGTPLLRTFLPQEYRAQGQNWAVVQDQRGLIYVGNNDGVLEFDGERWRLIKVSNQTTVRSLAVDANGRIYVGAVGEIGYLQEDAHGTMQYVSLMPKLNQEQRQFSDVWRCFANDQGIVFASFRRLLRIKGDKVDHWTPKQAFQWPFYLNKRLFVREAGRGLLELKGDRLELLAGGERFASERLYVMLSLANNTGANNATNSSENNSERYILGTQNQGFYVYENGQFRNWKTDIDTILKSSLLYSAAQMNDGSMYFGTVQSGLFHLDIDGKLLGHIDRSNGLPDQAVYGLAVDRDQGLWLALDRGISRIEVTDPLSRFHENNGLVGSSLYVHRHQEKLYSATTQGLYRLAPGTNAQFERIPNISGPTWGLYSFGQRLMIGNYQGIYVLDQNKVEKIPSTDTALCFLNPKELPNQLLIGVRNGVLRIQLNGDKWQIRGMLPGITDEVRTIVQDKQGDIWLGTNSTGVVRIRIRQGKEGEEHFETARYGANDGLPSQNKNWAYLINQEVRFGTNAGVFQFDANSNRFNSDNRFQKLFENPRPVYSIYEDASSRVWLFSQDLQTGFEEVSSLKLVGSEYKPIHTQALRALTGERGEGMQRILYDSDGVMWFGGTKGLFRLVPDSEKNYQAPFSTLIRNLSTSDNVIYGGHGLQSNAELEFSQNRLRFDYAATSYDGQQSNLYQVFLEGNDSGWSNWNTETYQDYSNLFEGKYRFRVRAKNIYGTVSEEANFSFTVKAPWYRSYLAYVCYAILIFVVVRLISGWRVDRLNAQKHLLEELVLARTKELEQAYAEIEKISLLDPLTGLGNRRHLTQSLSNLIPFTSGDDRRNGKGKRYAFVLIDIDHFKSINDTHGHASGDAILSGIAGILREHCRNDDLAVRWGGEEFLLCARVNDEHEALGWASRLRQAVGAARFPISEGRTVSTTCSIGIACFPFQMQRADLLTQEQVILIADACLYVAKRNGRDQCVCATPNGVWPNDVGQKINVDVQSFLQSGLVHLQSDKMKELA
ncbi:diguanylate cyclase [Undibacterium sp. LX40W]|uniref:diguanylate cyclase n=1 Tax=Undibacterium nitidum TaxID=2762298 RepID=A0A923KKU1_9BURK|nr:MULTISPECIES: ligand-binding sensor domain-containing diguanylate cyclase [Undibacterium]MBC3881130.1 diguanylate cyclase [Undibacterium nitidum]MBC3890137.1 diguanylate cyclase [Undibacterium sp. LX40W]